jgi:hypothetical protein
MRPERIELRLRARDEAACVRIADEHHTLRDRTWRPGREVLFHLVRNDHLDSETELGEAW